MKVPALRICAVNGAPVRPGGDFVLYWMIAARRAAHSFALDRAVALARELSRPLVVLEALRAGYPWASDRLHRFVLQGMAVNAAAFAAAGVAYHPYVEPRPGDGKGLLEALAARACAVVTDEFPAFFLPRMVAAAGARLRVRLEAIDGNGLLPLRAAERVHLTAFAFRAFLQRALPEHLAAFPS
ncbi:MAG TPA: deoxyribodipyrimidine photolyase, partial [Anaeromyxobacteraceae bacterium]|nr:deoxyribodipyrimidine photolyase [Anaeromyxobacteraceae bacterium]